MRKWLLIVGVLCAAPLFADQYRRGEDASLRSYHRSLGESRENYRHAVQSHGPHSREAMNARMQLRASRRTFHSYRRAAQRR